MCGYLKLYTSIISLLLINRVMTQNSETQEISNENENISSTIGSNTDDNKDEFKAERSGDVAETRQTPKNIDYDAYSRNEVTASLVQLFATIFMLAMLLLGLLLQGIPIVPFQTSLKSDFPGGSDMLQALPVAGITVTGGATGGIAQIVMSAIEGRTCPPGMCKPYRSNHCCCLEASYGIEGFFSCPRDGCESAGKSIQDTFSKLFGWLAK